MNDTIANDDSFLGLRPCLPADTVILENGEETLFLVPHKPDWLNAGKNLAAALLYCNGSHTLADLANALSGHPHRDSALAAIHDLVQDGFFTQGAPVREHATRLYSLHLNMTGQCNLKCSYCYAQERTRQENSLTEEDYHNLVDELLCHNFGEITLTFTGGEPLLNQCTIDLAAYARKKGLSTYLLTNGTLIDEHNIDRISEAFNTIRISLDGPRAEINDMTRGRGSFANATRGIKLLEEKGVPPLVAMTVTRANMHHVEEMASLYGGRLAFQPLYNVGAARSSLPAISGSLYYRMLAKARGVNPYARLSGQLTRLRNRGTHKCAIGDGEISIAPNGDVYPCHMLHEEKFRAGNIKDSPFMEIYRNSPVLEKIRALSVNTRPACRDCPVRLLCGGGCRARAYYATRDVDGPDDFCDYELLALRAGLLTRAPDGGE